MAHVAPFRALRYDSAQVDLAAVVTQPYDKITPEMQDRYYAASPHNLVRIILGKRQPADNSANNSYVRAASLFYDWRRQGIFRQDSRPSIYVYIQRFLIPGTETALERRGVIALGRIEDYSANIVFRHEQTLAKPKADRLDLLRATRAHFGQIFMLYSDPAQEIESALPATSQPDICVQDEYGVLHQLWSCSDSEVIEFFRARMRARKLIIADGHHRYETALAYRNERRAASTGQQSSSADSTPHDWVMMTLVNLEAPGLVILPTHRVVHGLPAFSADVLRENAKSLFSVEDVDPAIDDARARGILREAGRSGTALLAVTASRAFLLDRPTSALSGSLAGLSLRQQSLDVVQLHKCLLEGVLGVSEEAIRNQTNVRYVRDAGEALARVREGAADVAFLMNPVRLHQVRDLALAGEVLPQKSTDFYPKLLSGLTVYALD